MHRMENGVFDTYKSSIMLHGCHCYQTESDMAMDKSVHINYPNMHCHTGNVCYVAVKFSTYWSPKSKNYIITPTHFFKWYIFVFIT